ncbi:hypothetical protein ACFFRR_006240 [Megaselia abdita]
MIVLIISALVIICALFYYWIQKPRRYFEEIGIEYDPGPLFIGSFGLDGILKRNHFFDIAQKAYNMFESGIVGGYNMGGYAFLVKSPELIRQITITDFDHFRDRTRFFSDSEDSLIGGTLFHLVGQKWKDMRSSLTPAFTGSKLRAVFVLLRDISNDTVEHLKNTKPNELNLKDFMTRYANDVIATTAFGFHINSNREPDNEFFKMGSEVTDVSLTKLFFLLSCKKLATLIGFDLVSKKHHTYFMKLVLGAMKHRQTHDIFRPDMINMMMELRGMAVHYKDQEKNEDQNNWSDVEIVAQCFLFFFAAFDSVASALALIGQELIENPGVQDKLREEINEVTERLNGNPLTYDALKSMKYAEAIVLETTRKWPTQIFIDRVCTKAIVLHDSITGKDIPIKVGDDLQMPIAGLQRDPKFFPDPTKFDPERFNEENKRNIDPSTYLPFGSGPRMCIGNRFAMLEIKSLMYHLFKEFKFEPHEKSVIPLKLNRKSTKFEPVGGFWVKITPVE